MCDAGTDISRSPNGTPAAAPRRPAGVRRCRAAKARGTVAAVMMAAAVGVAVYGLLDAYGRSTDYDRALRRALPARAGLDGAAAVGVELIGPGRSSGSVDTPALRLFLVVEAPEGGAHALRDVALDRWTIDWNEADDLDETTTWTDVDAGAWIYGP